MSYNIKSQVNSKLIILTFIILFTTSKYSFSQITTNSSVNLDQLVGKIVGNGVTVKNAKFTGDGLARGTFNGTSSNIGLKEGIILATGLISNAAGPNDDPYQGIPVPANLLKSTNFGRVGDADLNTIQGCGDCTYDAAVLEFDFIPASSPLTFKYVFASEEYPFWVCSTFNDVFAFFISGPRPGGGNYNKQNIALITAGVPVAINTVNSGTPGYYIDPTCSCPNCICYFPTSDCSSLSYSSYFNDNGDGSTPGINTTVQYNGFTIPLTATVNVIPCQTYHMKLALSDVADGKYDSGIFLEANSFSSNTMTATTTFSNPKIDSVAVKGCNNAVVTFTLPKAPAQDTTITYTVGGTAKNGQDYTTLSGSVLILAGQKTGSFTLSPFLNGVTSGDLTFTFDIELTACSGTKTYTIKIKQNPEIVLTPGNDQSICVGKSVNISGSASGGVGALTYKWSNGGSLNNITVSPTETQTFTLSVTDVCNASKSADIKVTVNPLPVFTLTPASPISFCSGDSIVLRATTGEGYEYQWSNNSSTLNGATNNSYTAKAAGNYSVEVTNANNCSKKSESIVVTISQLQAGIIAKGDTNICKGSEVVLGSSNTGSNLTYQWIVDGNVISNATNADYTANTDGNYSVRVASSTSCFDTSRTIDVVVLALPVVKIKTEGGSLCSGKSVVIKIESASTEKLKYQWLENGNNISGATQDIYLASKKESYSLQVVDSNNCTSVSNKIEVEKALFYMTADVIIPEGKNECNSALRLEGLCLGKIEVSIFDRWGVKVFDKNYDFSSYTDALKCKGSGDCSDCLYYNIWDGKNNGGSLTAPGVYFYVIKAFDTEGNSINPKEGKLNGTVTLIK